MSGGKSYGINTQASFVVLFDEEVSETLTVCQKGGGVTMNCIREAKSVSGKKGVANERAKESDCDFR